MSKRKATADWEPEPPTAPQVASLPHWLKALISAVLAFHIAAVFVAPFAFASNSGPTPSPLADALFKVFRPYLGALFLDHGYFFFAPNPGPSHLVDYKVEFDDGRPPRAGRFPDLATERPRLLYHRHFMLSESLSNRFVPAERPPEPSPPPLTATPAEKALYQAARAEYDRQLVGRDHARKQYVAMRQSFEQHLKHQYGGSRVTLTRVEHTLPAADEVEFGGRQLNDPQSYLNMPETLPTRSGR